MDIKETPEKATGHTVHTHRVVERTQTRAARPKCHMHACGPYPRKPSSKHPCNSEASPPSRAEGRRPDGALCEPYAPAWPWRVSKH